MSNFHYTDELLKIQNNLSNLIGNVQIKLNEDVVDKKYDYILEELYGLWLEVKWAKEEVLDLEKNM